jgi:ATP-binding cassette subfamily B protein
MAMVWSASPGLTAASLVLRLIRALLPVATLFVGKLVGQRASQLAWPFACR